ncbi:unnamed protein product [Ophioblennius macclurei]
MACERGGGPAAPSSSPPPGPGPPPPRTGPTADHQLLVVVGALHSVALLERLLQDVEAGVRRWSVDLDVCDLDQQLKLFVSRHSAFLSEEVRGQRTLRHHGDVLDTQVLINPSQECVCSEVHRLALSPSTQKLLVLAGRRLELSGDVELQDGFFSATDLIRILANAAPPPLPGLLTISCPPAGSWNNASVMGLRVNPPLVLPTMEGLQEFTEYLSESLEPESLFQVLEAPATAGFLKLSRPCCYIFPGGRGDSAFFAVSGFNVLVDGGSNARSQFWKLVRHLDRIDSVLVTHAGVGSLVGVNGLLRRKVAELEVAAEPDEDQAKDLISPDLGVVFLNAPDEIQSAQEDPSELQGHQEAAVAVKLLEKLGIRPRPLVRNDGPRIEPLILFQKMGVGRLEMYTLNPTREDIEVPTKLRSDSVSICVLLVWHPSGPQEKIIRVLFPGCTPQNKILDGLERLKHLEFLKRPTACTEDLEDPGTVTRAESREGLKSKESRSGTAEKKAETKNRAKEVERVKATKVIPKTGSLKLKKDLKPELKKDPRQDPKKDLRLEPKRELKPKRDLDLKKDMRTELKKNLKPESNKDLKMDPKKDLGPKKDSKKEPKKESRMDLKKDSKLEPKKDFNPEVKKDSKAEVRKDLKAAKPEPKRPLSAASSVASAASTDIRKASAKIPKKDLTSQKKVTKEMSPLKNRDLLKDSNGNRTMEKTSRSLVSQQADSVPNGTAADSPLVSPTANGHIGGLPDVPHDVDVCLVSPCEFQHPNTSDLTNNDNPTPDPSSSDQPSAETLPTDSDVPPCTEDYPSISADLDSDEETSSSGLLSPPFGKRSGQPISLDPPPAPVKDLPPLPAQSGTCMVDPEANKKSSKSKRQVEVMSAHSSESQVYVELAYLPSGPAAATVDAQLFHRLRSRHYVVSGDGPAKDAELRRILDALLEGKADWPDVQVTLIPTFDSLAMHEWYRETLERQQALMLTVLGSNSTVAMQDESFAACKVEF